MSKLVVIRGNSGSGKSTIAERLHVTNEGSALIEQDYYIKYASNDAALDLRRKQRIFNDVRQALGSCGLVILEGVFDSRRYREYFDDLIRDHSDDAYFAYLDVSFEETLRRHELRDKRREFGKQEMLGWYALHDYLGYECEFIIDEDKSADESAVMIASIAGIQTS